MLARKLGSIGGISTKRMYGGFGIFHEGKMFSIVDSKGQFFLKIDDSNKAGFEERDAHQQSKIPYFYILDDVLPNQQMLIAWAKKSIEISK